MTLVAFTCRGRPAAMSRATLRRHGSLRDRSSQGVTFRRAVLRRPEPALLSVIERLCVTPLAVPLLQGFGKCQGNSRAASPAHGTSQPALRQSLRLRKGARLRPTSSNGRPGAQPLFVDGRRCLEIGPANRILFLNRVLGVIARIYQATSGTLPRSTISRMRPSGCNHLFGSRSTAQNRFFPSWLFMKG